MVYYPGPNKKVTRLNKDSSPTSSPTYKPTSSPTPTSPTSKGGMSTVLKVVILICSLIIVGLIFYFFAKWRRENFESTHQLLPFIRQRTPSTSPYSKW
jgi:hypothetical protein